MVGPAEIAARGRVEAMNFRSPGLQHLVGVALPEFQQARMGHGLIRKALPIIDIDFFQDATLKHQAEHPDAEPQLAGFRQIQNISARKPKIINRFVQPKILFPDQGHRRPPLCLVRETCS